MFKETVEMVKWGRIRVKISFSRRRLRSYFSHPKLVVFIGLGLFVFASTRLIDIKKRHPDLEYAHEQGKAVSFLLFTIEEVGSLFMRKLCD